MRFFLQNTTYIHFANPSEALAKIDLMQKCIFAMLTFYKVKCSAQHLLPSKQAKEVGFLWKNLFFAE